MFSQPDLFSREAILSGIAEESDSLTIEESDSSGVLVWDDEDCKMIPFHFLEEMSPRSLENLIYISPDIPAKYQIDQAQLANYLWNACDKNAFITMDELVVIWSEPDEPETFDPPDFIDSGTKHLYEKFGDEYAYEVCSELLGVMWFERNVVIVNMGEIVRTSERIAKENSDLCDPWFSFENQVFVGFMTTAIHELRHLQMDTNILLPEDLYPLALGTEDAVEEYCREVFEGNPCSMNILPNLFAEEHLSLDAQIDHAAGRTAANSSSALHDLTSHERT